MKRSDKLTMPKFDNSTQFYHEVEVDRREAHKDTISVFWFPLAWAALLGLAAAPLAWRITKVIDDPSPANWVYAFAAAVPLAYLLFYLAWWLRELGRLNRDARPPAEQPYTPPAPVRYEQVNSPTNKTYAFLTVSQEQLEKIARYSKDNIRITYRQLYTVFGRNDRSVEQFRQEAIRLGLLELDEGRSLIPTLKGVDFFADVLDMTVKAIPDPDPAPTPPPRITSESPMRPRHKAGTQ